MLHPPIGKAMPPPHAKYKRASGPFVGTYFLYSLSCILHWMWAGYHDRASDTYTFKAMPMIAPTTKDMKVRPVMPVLKPYVVLITRLTAGKRPHLKLFSVSIDKEQRTIQRTWPSMRKQPITSWTWLLVRLSETLQKGGDQLKKLI